MRVLCPIRNSFSAAERILLRSRQLVDVRKDDGFAALHLASLNGHLQVTVVFKKYYYYYLRAPTNSRCNFCVYARLDGKVAAEPRTVYS